MIRIAVCDDEKTYLDALCALLARYAQSRQAQIDIQAFSTSSALLDALEGGVRHHIYLLDIYMPGLSGMSVAAELRSRGIKSPIVFLTSSTDHAVEAFGVDATHYLLKPYTAESFFMAMDKAMERTCAHDQESVVLKVDGEYHTLAAGEILYCQAQDKYQRIYLANGEKPLVRITSAELYAMLEDFGCFCRCGRAYIINLGHLKKIMPKGALLKNGEQLALPRGTVAGLRAAFFRYFSETAGEEG